MHRSSCSVKAINSISKHHIPPELILGVQIHISLTRINIIVKNTLLTFSQIFELEKHKGDIMALNLVGRSLSQMESQKIC